eukprot:COSAG01_NODE_291_length_19378_cov_38.136418_6_plen_460_part_00
MSLSRISPPKNHLFLLKGDTTCRELYPLVRACSGSSMRVIRHQLRRAIRRGGAAGFSSCAPALLPARTRTVLSRVVSDPRACCCGAAARVMSSHRSKGCRTLGARARRRRRPRSATQAGSWQQPPPAAPLFSAPPAVQHYYPRVLLSPPRERGCMARHRPTHRLARLLIMSIMLAWQVGRGVVEAKNGAGGGGSGPDPPPPPPPHRRRRAPSRAGRTAADLRRCNLASASARPAGQVPLDVSTQLDVIENPIVAKATALQTVLNTHVLAMMDIAATPVSIHGVATLTNIEIVVMAPAFLVLFRMAAITRALVSLVIRNHRIAEHAACVPLDMGGQDRVEDNAPCAPAQNTKPQPAMHPVYHVKRVSTKAWQAKQAAACVVQAQLPTLSVAWGRRHARHAHRVSSAQHLRCNAVSASPVRRRTPWRAVVLQHARHAHQVSSAQHLRCNAVSAGLVRRRTR